MDIIWERGEATALEVRRILAQRRPVARETVRTLLSRMEEKGWLTHRVVGRTFLYAAALPREASLGRQVVNLVDTLCGGSAETLMSALLDHRGLTEDEADRIQAMIDAARKKNRPPTKTRRKP
jgi:predicted transcriptional regulator